MAKTFDKAVTGFNHNIKHKGKVYHVQTEDSGVNNPHIITHLFVGGNILASKKELEARAGKKFDETFVAGFSSGAYYGSSLALRSAIDVDGFMFFAGGSGWVKPVPGGKRAPVFVAPDVAMRFDVPDEIVRQHDPVFILEFLAPEDECFLFFVLGAGPVFRMQQRQSRLVRTLKCIT